MRKSLEIASKQPFKFKRKKWVELNDDVSGTYSTNSQIELKTLILK